MVILLDTKSKRPVFYFWGSSAEWDNLIYGNLYKADNIFLCDKTAPIFKYPSRVKLIKSEITARRFLGIGLRNTLVFINAENLKILDKFRNIVWHGATYLIFRMNREDLIDVCLTERVDLCSKRSVKYLKLYK